MNGSNTVGTQISTREIFAVIFRRRIPILICAIVVTAAALSAASRSKSVYDATAKVLLRRTGATALSTSWTPFYDLEEEMNTEVEIVKADPVLARAVAILQEKGVTVAQTIDKQKIQRPVTIDDLSSGVSAAPMEASNIMLIKFRASEPRFAREAANAVAAAYVDYRVMVRKTGGTEEYFADQINKLDSTLVDLNKQELRLRKEGNLEDREWQQRVVLNRQSELQLRLNETRARRAAEESKLAAMKARMEEDPTVIWPFPVDPDDDFARIMLTEYWELRRDRDDKASQLTPSNPEVLMMDDKIAKMEQRLREETQRRLKDRTFLIEDLRAEEAAHETEIAEVGDEMLPNPDLVAQVDHLQQRIHYTYLHYDRVLEKMLDMMASEADDIRISNAKLLSPATVQMGKAGKMRSVYVVFSIMLGITLGIGFGFLLENLDHSVRSASDISEVVGVPLLGSIPETHRVSEIGKTIDGRFGPEDR